MCWENKAGGNEMEKVAKKSSNSLYLLFIGSIPVFVFVLFSEIL